jgi:molecular chaperone IbpA
LLAEDMSVTTVDFTPLFRTAIGFEHLAEALESAYRADAGGYPPYNIEATGPDQYLITMAVAGFTKDDLDLQVRENILSVSGARSQDETKRKFLYRGIATRSFERQFQLADYVRVAGAELKDGLLDISLVREVPEGMQPRRIKIGSAENRAPGDKVSTSR